MIDANGNKIVPKEEEKDLDFMHKEIRFLLKAFLKSQDDRKAISLSHVLLEFLDAGGDMDACLEVLKLLEDYAPETGSEDFVWDLVYARRRLKARQDISPEGKRKAAEHAQTAARHFRNIIRINPSTHNRCCEVSEVAEAVSPYVETSDDITLHNLRLSQELFENIPAEDISIYHYAGASLNLCLVLNSSILGYNSDAELQRYLKLIHHCREHYKISQKTTYLNTLAAAYIDCLRRKQLCIEDERQNIRDVISWMEKAASEDKNTFQKNLDALRKCFAPYDT